MKLTALIPFIIVALGSCKKDDTIFSPSGAKLPIKMSAYATDKNNLTYTQYYKYDSKGNRIETRSYDKNDINYYKIRFEYNSQGNLTKERYYTKQPDGSLLEMYYTKYLWELDSSNNARLIKEEKINYHELTNWVNYQYEHGKLNAKVFYVRYPQFNQTSISGKDEFEYDAAGRLYRWKRFFGDNTIPSLIHEMEYSDNLLVKENITGTFLPERIEYSYNSRRQLVSKKHFEVNSLLKSLTNIYDDEGLLIEKITFDRTTSSWITTYIDVYEY